MSVYFQDVHGAPISLTNMLLDNKRRSRFWFVLHAKRYRKRRTLVENLYFYCSTVCPFCCMILTRNYSFKSDYTQTLALNVDALFLIATNILKTVHRTVWRNTVYLRLVRIHHLKSNMKNTHTHFIWLLLKFYPRQRQYLRIQNLERTVLFMLTVLHNGTSFSYERFVKTSLFSMPKSLTLWFEKILLTLWLHRSLIVFFFH